MRSWQRNRPACVAALPPGQRVLAQHQTPPCQPGTALLPQGSTPASLYPSSWPAQPGSARLSEAEISPNSLSSESLRVPTGVHMHGGHK